ncbi:hypothetical protein HOE49_05460 [Candidatus Peregrinibacteria bacterium]|nr:hypothetical protein [Candidatus Peregrinibacteria bacterium]
MKGPEHNSEKDREWEDHFGDPPDPRDPDALRKKFDPTDSYTSNWLRSNNLIKSDFIWPGHESPFGKSDPEDEELDEDLPVESLIKRARRTGARMLGMRGYQSSDWGYSAGKYEFEEPTLYSGTVRGSDESISLRLPRGISNRRGGWSFDGDPYIMEHSEAPKAFDVAEDLKIPEIEKHQGSVEKSEESIRIKCGKRRRVEITEDEISAMFFDATTNKRFGVWQGSYFSPAFYRELILRQLDDPEVDKDNPFEWALKRAEKAIAFVVAKGFGDEFYMESITGPFKYLAKDICNLHQPELDMPREFPNTEKTREIFEKLKFNGKDPTPETLIFILSIQKDLLIETLSRTSIRDSLKKMPTWLENGLVIDRAIELFQLLKTKTGNSTGKALLNALQIIDGIYGSKGETPWYFRENLNFKNIFYGTKILVMDPEEAVKLMTDIGKESGPAFENTIKNYFYENTGAKLEEFIDRKQAIKLVAKVTRQYGIKTPKRVKNIMQTLVENLAEVKRGERESFIETYMNHILSEGFADEIESYLQGDECKINLPGFSVLMKVLYAGDPEATKDCFDITADRAQLNLLQEGVNAPLEKRANSKPVLRDQRYLETPLFKTGDVRLMLPAPTVEETKQIEKHSPEQRNIMQRILEFYENTRKELGHRNISDAVYAYFTFFAAKMPDPFAPPEGLMKLVEKIRHMPETDRVNAMLFGNPFNGEKERKTREIIPRKVIRFGALMNLVNAWLEGSIEEEYFMGIIKFLLSKDFTVRNEETFEEYLERHLQLSLRSFEREQEYLREHPEDRHSSDDESEKDVIKRFAEETDHYRERYDDKTYKLKNGEQERRVNNFVRYMSAYAEFKEVLDMIDIEAITRGDFLKGLMEKMLEQHPDERILPNKTLLEELRLYSEEMAEQEKKEQAIDTEENVEFSVIFGEQEEGEFDAKDYEEFVKQKVSDWSGLLGEREVSFAKYLESIIGKHGIPEAIEKLKSDLAKESSQKERQNMIFQFFGELKMLQTLQSLAEAVLKEITDRLNDEGEEGIDIENIDNLAIEDLIAAHKLTELEREKMGRMHRQLEALEGVLETTWDKGLPEKQIKGFEYVPKSLAESLLRPITRVKEMLAIIAAISDIRTMVGEHIDQKRAGAEVKKEDEKMVRQIQEATRTTMSVISTISAMFYHDQLQNLMDQKALPDNVIVFPGANSLVATDSARLGEEALMTAQQIREKVVKRASQDMPRIDSWIENIRTEEIGLFPVGAKIHVIHPVNQRAFEKIKRLLGLNSTPFRLIHAGESIVIPPTVTAKELSVFLFSLQQLGLIDPEYPELQICGPGRISNDNAAITGSAILLSTEVGKHYPRDAFVTTHSQTGTRMMAYDAGIYDTNFPYMTKPDGEKVEGRTDIQGRRSIKDIDTYRLLHTVVAHTEFDMVFADIGRWFIPAYRRLLIKYDMADVLDAKWIMDPRTYEDYSTKNADQNRHYEVIQKCTNAYFECADGENDIVYAVRDLIQELAEKVRERQEEIKANPDKYEHLIKDWKLAKNF